VQGELLESIVAMLGSTIHLDTVEIPTTFEQQIAAYNTSVQPAKEEDEDEDEDFETMTPEKHRVSYRNHPIDSNLYFLKTANRRRG
jgi:hypothetical protein